MKKLKKAVKKVLNHSLLVGMVSIFCPSVIHVEQLPTYHEDDADALASDWKAVGSYIQDAYDGFRKGS